MVDQKSGGGSQRISWFDALASYRSVVLVGIPVWGCQPSFSLAVCNCRCPVSIPPLPVLPWSDCKIVVCVVKDVCKDLLLFF